MFFKKMKGSWTEKTDSLSVPPPFLFLNFSDNFCENLYAVNTGMFLSLKTTPYKQH